MIYYNKNFTFQPFVHRSCEGPVPHPYPLCSYISARDPASNLPLAAFLCWGAFPAKCTLPADAAGNPQSMMERNWCINTSAPSLGHVFSSESQSFPCRIELQLPIVVTASQPPSSAAFLPLSLIPSPVLVFSSLLKQATFI